MLIDYSPRRLLPSLYDWGMDNPLKDARIYWDALLLAVLVVGGVAALVSELLFDHIVINVCAAFIAILTLAPPAYRRATRERTD